VPLVARADRLVSQAEVDRRRKESQDGSVDVGKERIQVERALGSGLGLSLTDLLLIRR
jgi:hypothetical protein